MTAGKGISKLLRKYNGNLTLVGHTGRDIPRDVCRQLLMVRKKEATIGVGLKEENKEIQLQS